MPEFGSKKFIPKNYGKIGIRPYDRKDEIIRRLKQTVETLKKEMKTLAKEIDQHKKSPFHQREDPIVKQSEFRVEIEEPGGEKKPEPPFPFQRQEPEAVSQDRLILELMGHQQEQIQKDNRRIEETLANANYWVEQARVLFFNLEKLKSFVYDWVDNSAGALQILPEELQILLEKPHRDLTLIGETLDRLTWPSGELKTLTSDIQKPDDLFVLNRDTLDDFLNTVAGKRERIEDLETKLKELRFENQKIVFNLCKIAENRKKNLLEFCRRNLLPIMENLEEKETILSRRIRQFKINYPQFTHEIESWYETFTVISEKMSDVIKKSGFSRNFFQEPPESPNTMKKTN